jgi:hypothetical protein
VKSITKAGGQVSTSSSNTASPSDRTIHDKIAEPSCGNLIATRPLPPRSRVRGLGVQMLAVSRLLAVAETSTYREIASVGSALRPPVLRSAVFVIVTKLAKAATGFQGSPMSGTVPIYPSAIGFRGLIAKSQKCRFPNCSIAFLTWSSSTADTPPEVTIKSGPIVGGRVCQRSG